MGRYFAGKTAPFATAAQREALIGQRIRYVRDCDIDRSGRGYFFPRIDEVIGAKGTQLLFSDGNSVARGDLVEVQIVGGE